MGKSNSIQIKFKVELNEGMVRSISFIQTVVYYDQLIGLIGNVWNYIRKVSRYNNCYIFVDYINQYNS